MFNKYPVYKDNGIINIPSHWNEIAFNWLFKKKEISNLPNENLLSVYLDRGVIPYSEGGGLVHKPAESLEKYQLVEQDDFVMNNQQAWRGSVGISKYRGIVSPAYLIYTPDIEKLLPKFLNYLLRDKYIVNEFMNASLSVGTIQRQIKSHLLKKIKIPFPSLGEQAQIANFLDQETQKIDNLIAKQEKLIELLEEQRKSIISYAVTKGVNPNAKMKVSGVEWLGEVPEHWTVTAVKRLLEIPITDGPHETPEFVDNGIPFISAEAIFNSKIDFDKKRGFITSAANELYSKKYSPKLNDIYMVKSGATTGKVAIVETEEIFNIWSPLAVFRCQNEKINYKFLFYFFRSAQFYKALCLNWSYGTQQNIGMKTLGNIQVAFPSQIEQIEVVNHIEKENIKLDLLIQKEISLVEKLKEYRASIICHAVTGQIDVRDLVE